MIINPVDLSIVVPVYNERDNVMPCVEDIHAVLETLNLKSEIILVDDGSTDGTTHRSEDLARRFSRVTAVLLRKNFGQTSALVAGFDHAKGEILIAMDGDRQNDPADIPRLLEKMDEGYDIVAGWRRHRKDTWLTRRLPSFIANKVISRITGVALHDYGCSLKAFRREVVENTSLYGEMHRFIPAVASWMGIRLAEIEVNHHPRRKGVSKYGLSRTIRVILDLITVKFLLSFATKPIQVFGFWGLLAFFTGSVLFAWVVYQRFWMHIPANRPLLTISILLIISAIQFISFGLLAEMQVRIYHESTKKAIYAVKKIIS